MFRQVSVEEDESSGEARFEVTFDPEPTEISFTFIVETFDLTPVPDAEGR